VEEGIPALRPARDRQVQPHALIATIANHLRFDIYDLELTGVDRN
jgi:hypothetical protein